MRSPILRPRYSLRLLILFCTAAALVCACTVQWYRIARQQQALSELLQDRVGGLPNVGVRYRGRDEWSSPADSGLWFHLLHPIQGIFLHDRIGAEVADVLSSAPACDSVVEMHFDQCTFNRISAFHIGRFRSLRQIRFSILVPDSDILLQLINENKAVRVMLPRGSASDRLLHAVPADQRHQLAFE